MMMPKIVDHEARRREIAAAAAAAIDDVGIDAVRLVDVAERANCTTGAVAHYFRGKDAVLVAALEHSLGGLVETATADPETVGGAGFVERLTWLLPTTAENARDWRIWLSFAGRAAHDRGLAAIHRAAYGALQSGLADELERLGLARGDEAAELASGVIAAIDGIGLRAVLEPEDWPAERQRRMLRRQLRALLADEGREIPRALPLEQENPR